MVGNFSEAAYANILQIASADVQKNSGSTNSGGQQNNNNGAPLWFIDNGEHVMRFYFDPQSNKVTRPLKVHRIPKIGTYVCTGEATCPICRGLNQMKNGWKEAWKYAARDNNVQFVYLYSTTTDNKYIRSALSQPSILIGDWKFKNELSRLLTTLNYEMMAQLLDINSEAPMIRISYKSGKGGECHIYIDNNKGKPIPPIPSTFPSLDDAYIRDNQIPDEIKMNEIMTFFYNESHGMGISGMSINPQTQMLNTDPLMNQLNQMAGNTAQRPAGAPMATPQSQGGFNAGNAVIANNTQPVSNGSDHPECFGKHPSGPNPQCIICNFEQQCQSLSAGGNPVEQADIPF